MIAVPFRIRWSRRGDSNGWRHFFVVSITNLAALRSRVINLPQGSFRFDPRFCSASEALFHRIRNIRRMRLCDVPGMERGE